MNTVQITRAGYLAALDVEAKGRLNRFNTCRSTFAAGPEPLPDIHACTCTRPFASRPPQSNQHWERDVVIEGGNLISRL